MTSVEQVREFHEAFGSHVGDGLSVPPQEICYQRARLLVEECAEAVSELLAGHPDADSLADSLIDMFADRCIPPLVPVDPVRVAHELADLVYVTAGAAVNFGIPLDAVVTEVHRANMAKLGPDGKPIIDEHGKGRKPPGWKPPDVAAAIGLRR